MTTNIESYHKAWQGQAREVERLCDRIASADMGLVRVRREFARRVHETVTDLSVSYASPIDVAVAARLRDRVRAAWDRATA